MSIWQGILALLFVGIGELSLAGSLRVTPTRIELDVHQPAGVLTVYNSGSNPSLVQVDAMQWSQPAGEDEYTASTDILASPPVFTLEPGATQTVRVGLRKHTPLRTQSAYRLYIQEVPMAGRRVANTLNMVLRIGIPLFVNPETPRAGELAWALTCDAVNGSTLRIRNAGGRAIRIDDLRLGQRERFRALYVLAGSERQLVVEESPSVANELAVHAIGDHGETRTQARCRS